MSTETKTPHIGRQIRRMRELCGMKQDALADALGVSQQTVSHMENNEYLEDRKLKEVAKALGVTKEAIENFSEEAVMNFFNTTFNDNSSGQNGPYGTTNIQCDFNPLDKLIEIFEENKKLHEENKNLFERLLQAEKDKIVYLEKTLNKLKQ